MAFPLDDERSQTLLRRVIDFVFFQRDEALPIVTVMHVGLVEPRFRGQPLRLPRFLRPTQWIRARPH
jgi:hypothetical protein